MFHPRNFVSKCVLVSLPALVAASAAGGCTQQTDDDAIEDTSEALSSTANKILGFESTSNWGVTSGSSIVLKSSSTHTQGSTSLAVNAHGATAVRSAAIAVSSALPADITLDVQIPSHSSSGWTGTAQLFGECASKGLAKTSWGSKSLGGLPTNKFSTLAFKVPSTSLSKLANGCSDLRLTVALSVPSSSTGNYLLDNIQLGGLPSRSSCSPLVESRPGWRTGGYSSSVTRPDYGTFTFDYWVYYGTTKSETKSLWLNGTLVYQSTSSEDPDGTTLVYQDMLSPVLPEHRIFSSSDGRTMFLDVDGKQTPSVAVGTDPNTLRFTDGTALPNLTIDPNIRDVLVAFEKDVGANAATCLSSSAATGLLALAGDPHYGSGGVSGSQCTAGELGCLGAEATCIGIAAVTAASCTIGYGICFGLISAGCILAHQGCLGVIHRSGTDCCPVACGGESGLTTPIGACCNYGETCGRRRNDDHAALCCTPGTTVCGGELCCTAGEQCATKTSGPPQRGLILNAACCGPDKMNSRGECCNLGKCTTSADCGGSNTCNNGCCVIG
jgi:hypothetical protein